MLWCSIVTISKIRKSITCSKEQVLTCHNLMNIELLLLIYSLLYMHIFQICEMKNCSKCIYFEAKKKEDLYMWWELFIVCVCTCIVLQEYLRNECLFFWVNWEWIGAQDKQIAWTTKQFLGHLFVSALRFIPDEPRKKRHSFLIFTMFPPKVLSKILWEKL